MNAQTTDDHAKPWETVRRGLLLLMSSPAGAGKTSLSRRLVADYADMVLSSSATTRGPRPGEEEGREYYFKTRESFEAMIAAGDLLEWAEVNGALYGMSGAGGTNNVGTIYSFAPVPEPSSLLLLAAGAVMARWRFQRKHSRRSAKPGSVTVESH